MIALLTILAVEKGTAHSRATLIGMLFSESADAKARQNLSQTLTRLRRVLAPHADLIKSTRHTITIADDALLTTDYHRFGQLIADANLHAHEQIERCATCQKRLREAVALVRGDLLTGLDLVDSVGFEEWLVLERARISALYLDALALLADGAIVREAYEDAADFARRQLAVESWREQAHRQLIIALALNGERPAALSQYTVCRDILLDELGVQPSATTQQLAKQVRDGTLQAPSALATADNLPHDVTPFIGRTTEIEEIAALLKETNGYRVVTLLGQGGIGKTRLALQVGRELIDSSHFAEVAFVSLVGVERDALGAVADGLGVALHGTQPVLEQVIRHLTGQTTLLILDNFEQLVGEFDWLVQLLRRVEQVRVLVTSRVQLEISAETVYAVSGLPAPPSDAPLATARDYPAAELFIDRARSHSHLFRVTADNWPRLIEITRRLDGLPLGIELAATWVRELSLAQIEAQIVGSLDMLATTLRDVPVRQRSLRAVYANMWETLSDDEARTLAQLSVMRGAFDLRAATSVAQTNPLTLRRLQARSLLRMPTIGRYDMHELVRQFSAEKRTSTQPILRHVEHYLTLVSNAGEQLDTVTMRAAADRLRAANDNIRAAWDNAITHAQYSLLDAAVEPLITFLLYAGRWDEADELLARTLAAVTQAAHLVAALRVQQAAVATRRKLPKSAAIAHRAYEAAVAVGDDQLALDAQITYIHALIHTGQMDLASNLVETLLPTAENLPTVLVKLHNERGFIAYLRGQHAEAQTSYETVIRISQQTGHTALLKADAFGHLANITSEWGQLGIALDYFAKHLDLMQQLGDERGYALGSHWYANTLSGCGRYEQALALEASATAIFRRIGDAELEAFSAFTTSHCYLKLGQHDQALEYAKRSVALATQFANSVSLTYAYIALADVMLAQDQLNEAADAYSTARTYARQASPLDVLYIDAHRAEIARRRGQLAEARRLAEPLGELLLESDEMLDIIDAVVAYRDVMVTVGEAEAAQAVIRRIRDKVVKSAETIQDPVLRHSFLHNVAAHRALCC